MSDAQFDPTLVKLWKLLETQPHLLGQVQASKESGKQLGEFIAALYDVLAGKFGPTTPPQP
jgi:hypothetical protein